jgi:hypothetical protein
MQAHDQHSPFSTGFGEFGRCHTLTSAMGAMGAASAPSHASHPNAQYMYGLFGHVSCQFPTASWSNAYTYTYTSLVTSCVAATSCQHHLKLGLKIQVGLAKIILCLWHLWQFLGLETPWKGIQGDRLRLRGKWGFPLSPSDFWHVVCPSPNTWRGDEWW